MLTSEILRGLPGTLDWMVLFDLPTLRGVIADPVVRSMFLLPQDANLGLYSHVVLTSRGPLVASREGSSLISSNGTRAFLDDERDACLYDRFSDRFDLFPVDEADCLAVGEIVVARPTSEEEEGSEHLCVWTRATIRRRLGRK